MTGKLYSHAVRRRVEKVSGFTLVELLVAMAVLAILVVVFAQIFRITAFTWSSTRQKVDSFQSARAAFEILKTQLASATLNPCLDYVDATGNFRLPSNAKTFVPAGYARTSELHFLSGLTPGIKSGAMAATHPGHAIFFQTPAAYSLNASLRGLPGLLNACGFYVEYGDGNDIRPDFMSTLAMPSRYRYRLYQVLQPTERLRIHAGSGQSWIESADRSRGVLAENVIALIVLPTLSESDELRATGEITRNYLTEDYRYDTRAWDGGTKTPRTVRTRNQLPPIVRLMLVAVSEESMLKMEVSSTTPFASLFVELFENPADYAQDVEKLKKRLGALSPPLDYRIFQTDVALNEAKWSEN